ncbi:MAG: hypothetical protein D6788_04495 [Planctomycetota bacterium]|nr:MAG: hypothetical protein D6788_04495 [Planctomycetota bacterium]
MRTGRDFFSLQSDEFGFLWKYQMLLGILVVLTGLLIALFPEILVILVSAATMMVGISLIGSAWRMRRLQRECRGFAVIETFEW